MAIKKVPLGKDGPLVPALGFGMMGLSYAYGEPPSDEERFKILDRALALGNIFWDTADLYGDSEILLKKWFQRTGKRDQIFLADKFGFVKGKQIADVDSSATYCKQACNASLEALGIDVIDLYYCHSCNPETPIEETMRALVELQKEGKIRYIGLSSVSSATLRRAVKIAPVTAVQTEYSVISREIEGPEGTDLLATCRELGVAVVVAMPLGRGLITPTFTAGNTPLNDVRQRLPRFQEENREKNMETLRRFGAIAAKKGCTPSQLALAWLLKQGDDIIPIPGTKTLKYVDENWASLDVVLSDEDEKEVRAFAEASPMAGSSVPPAFGSYLFRDTKEE
ncbi:aldo-keto reductase (AKR13) [Niveomyces insectorum RCEF 264]|uniref:Aldo-keto reductase (AKR13) n=1 Tax=Niveomyces insectorum RCEF 264 TaxID=1081102 RepID=A0A167T7E1_9HYPO|nr:aldo-keto reductase (AKR13) [Niveomyces insectorum RCEF 264]